MLYIASLITRISITFLFLLLILQSQAQTLGFSIEGGEKSVDIPFESYNNLIVVPIVLNNAIPLKFVVDTGVRTSILTERTFTDILNISYNRKITLVGADGDKEVDAYVASGISLMLPGVTGEGHVLLILEEDYLQLKNYLGTDVHGILGFELFRRFVVEFDYINEIMTLHEPTSFKPRRRFIEIPILLEDTKPYLFADLTLENGTTIKSKLMMDTGASHSILLDVSSHENLSLPEKTLRCDLGRGLGGIIEGYIGRVKELAIKEFTFHDLIVSFPDTASFGEVFTRTGRQGTIGGGILSKFNVVIDYFNKKVYLRKNRDYKRPFEYNMSGLDLMAVGKTLNTFVITNVREGSTSDRAGIKESDIILTINGMNAEDMDLGQINSFFRLKEGKKIKLKILRGEEKIKKTFLLERVI